MAWPVIDFKAIQHRLVLDNLLNSSTVLLRHSEVREIIGEEAYAAYAAEVSALLTEATAAADRPVSVGREASYYWSAATKVIVEAAKLARMSERGDKAKMAKAGAANKLLGRANDLVDLWEAVPPVDQDKFHKLDVEGAIDNRIIPGVELPSKDPKKSTKVRAKVVQGYSLWIIKSEYDMSQELQLVPWQQQVEALERHLGVSEPEPVQESSEVAEAVKRVMARREQFAAWGQK